MKHHRQLLVFLLAIHHSLMRSRDCVFFPRGDWAKTAMSCLTPCRLVWIDDDGGNEWFVWNSGCDKLLGDHRPCSLLRTNTSASRLPLVLSFLIVVGLP
jgi:hypothetical protein